MPEKFSQKIETKQEKGVEGIFPKPEEFIKIMREQGLEKHAQAYEKVLEIAAAIKEAGGLALLVGGSVRDAVMGKVSKDFDMEVYRLEAVKVEEIVKRFGKVSEVGKAFGILKIGLETGMDIDVSLPRTDSKIGEGHRGFEVKTDPFMSIKDAGLRRDFTMNAIAADPMTGEVFDSYNGVSDIKNKIIRITDPERFKDDPLRVLRALQFIGRFGLELASDSIPVIQEMAMQLKELPKERIGEEWKKLLLKSQKPSLGLSSGMLLGVFREVHPEFPPLAETKQEPEWHPEGDVWVHTLMSVDEAAKISKRENLDEDKALTLLLATLCHDLGKPKVTELKEGKIKSIGHEQAGEEPTKKFLASIGTDNLTRDKVIKMVTNHLIPTMFYIEEIKGKKISDGAIRRLAQRIHPATIQELVLVCEADHMGRGLFEEQTKESLMLPPDKFPPGSWLLEKARKLAVDSSKPSDLTQGRDWLNFGFKQGKEIGTLNRLANDLRDEKGFTREMVFQTAYGAKEVNDAISMLEKALKEK